MACVSKIGSLYELVTVVEYMTIMARSMTVGWMS